MNTWQCFIAIIGLDGINDRIWTSRVLICCIGLRDGRNFGIRKSESSHHGRRMGRSRCHHHSRWTGCRWIATWCIGWGVERNGMPTDARHPMEQVYRVWREPMFHIASLHLIHVKVDKSFGQTTRMGDLGLAMTMTSVFALFAFGSLDKPLVT